MSMSTWRELTSICVINGHTEVNQQHSVQLALISLDRMRPLKAIDRDGSLFLGHRVMDQERTNKKPQWWWWCAARRRVPKTIQEEETIGEQQSRGQAFIYTRVTGRSAIH